MKNLSQRGVLLFGVVLAVCVFVVPSLASAASWSPINTTHHLFSPNLGFNVTSGPVGGAGWACAGSSFDVDVVNANTIEVTRGGFQGCMGTFNAVNCTATPVGTFPWTATATSTADVQIHGVNITVLFENTPGNPTACPIFGSQITLTGTLTGGSWNPTSNELTLFGSTNLTAHFLGTGGLNAPAFAQGTLRDTSGTLRMFM